MPPAHRISIFPDPSSVARALAGRIAVALRANPTLVLGLPTGRTPLLLYEELVKLYSAGQADFSRTTTFNLDEFVGIPASHPGSYRSFMQRHLFDHVNIDPANVHVLDGRAPDTAAEGCRYEKAIVEAGGIDLQILGIGTNGHIGFNEPGPALEARTHRVTLKAETRRSNAALFGGDTAAVPLEALSMGMATILHARSIVLVATGERKAPCVRKLVLGSITTDLPASFLQVHDEVEIMLDEGAAGRLTASPRAAP
ncbi:MAG: glucosamine-6-phosphate deaminase [Acidobacteria bacterium]|nr:glucosamine-6-phosphate deaminase [Acidobacteriota bacterium]